MNRARHLPTVADEQPNRVATVLLSVPSAHASTIRDRNANACADFARRDQRTSCSRSSLVRTNEALGRPVLAIDPVYNLSCELRAQDIRGGRPFPRPGGRRPTARAGAVARDRRPTAPHLCHPCPALDG